MTLPCVESTNTIIIEKEAEGFRVRPCCWFICRTPNFAKSIEEINSHEYMKNIRKQFAENWQDIPGCKSCVDYEKAGIISNRQNKAKFGNFDGVVRWDIRFGNTCNLKCIMCTPKFSSKWNEDIDIHKKYNSPQVPVNLTDDEWEYIYEHTKIKAEEIYFAGGEPLYDKKLIRFLDKLSQHKRNRNFTHIQLQTNAVIVDTKIFEVLSRFKHVSFNISVDGWGKVNELIRFPTNHAQVVKNIEKLQKISNNHIYFVSTLQAMNLPEVDIIKENLSKYTNPKLVQITNLNHPFHLAINALKPHVIKRLKKQIKNKIAQEIMDQYVYDEKSNKKMQSYLLELDARRNTDSRSVVPWCFE